MESNKKCAQNYAFVKLTIFFPYSLHDHDDDDDDYIALMSKLP